MGLKKEYPKEGGLTNRLGFSVPPSAKRALQQGRLDMPSASLRGSWALVWGVAYKEEYRTILFHLQVPSIGTFRFILYPLLLYRPPETAYNAGGTLHEHAKKAIRGTNTTASTAEGNQPGEAGGAFRAARDAHQRDRTGPGKPEPEHDQQTGARSESSPMGNLHGDGDQEGLAHDRADQEQRLLPDGEAREERVQASPVNPQGLREVQAEALKHPPEIPGSPKTPSQVISNL